MQLSNYETVALDEIEEWERKGHEGFHKKVLDVTSRPIDYAVNKIGKEKFGIFEKALGKTIRRLLRASSATIEPKELLERAHRHGIMIDDISEIKYCDLKQLDACNRKNIGFHKRAGAIQGAVAGLGGALTATADIMALLIQDFHMIQEIVFCHGFDPDLLVEKQIVLCILEGAIGGSEMKFKALEEIAILRQLSEEADAAKLEPKQVPILGAKALEEYIEHLGAALIIRLIPRAVPIVSVVVSAHSNHEIMEHSADMAFMVYRKRFVERKLDL